MKMKLLITPIFLVIAAVAHAEPRGVQQIYAQQARQSAENARHVQQIYAQHARQSAENARHVQQIYAQQSRQSAENARHVQQLYAQQSRARSSGGYSSPSYSPSYIGPSYSPRYISPGYSPSYSSPSYSPGLSGGWRVVSPDEYYGDGFYGGFYEPQVIYPEGYYGGEYVQPQEYRYVRPENVIVLKTSNLELQVPKGATIKVDGNYVSTSNDVLRMSFEGMRPDKERSVRIDVAVRDNGYEQTGSYKLKLEYGKDHKGKMIFEPQNVRDYLLDELTAKSKQNLADLAAWHEQFGKTVQNRHDEVERWRDGMLQQLKSESEAIRTELTAEVSEKVAVQQKFLDELTTLFTEEHALRKRTYESAIASATESRAKKASMADVQAAWDAEIKSIEARDFKKKSATLLAEELKSRQSYLFSSSLQRQRSIQGYLTGTLNRWLTDALKVSDAWKVSAHTKYVKPLRDELADWERKENERIAAVKDEVILEIIQKAFEAELKRRADTIAALEAALDAELEARKQAHHRVFAAFEKEYRDSLTIKSSLQTQKQLDVVEATRREGADSSLLEMVSAERSAREKYVPAATTIDIELTIRKYRVEKGDEFAKKAADVQQWASELRGSRMDDLAKWRGEQDAELAKIPHRPVVAVIAKRLQAEWNARTKFETERKQSIDELEQVRLKLLQQHLAEFITEYRATRADTTAATRFNEALPTIMQRVEALQANLLEKLAAEEKRRAGYAGVVAMAKEETARYPLALKLPETATGYFLGFELDETLGLYFVDSDGKRTRIACFDGGTLVDAVARDGKLLVLSRGAKSLDAPAKLTDSSNAEIASFASNRGTSVFLFDKETLILVQKPDLVNAVFERVWSDESGDFFVNIAKADKKFTLQIASRGDGVDIVETKEAPAAEPALFQRVEK